MRQLFTEIDALLRGHRPLPRGQEGDRALPSLRTLLAGALVLGAIYGAFMGLFGALRGEGPSLAQLPATTAKVPLLFLLTLSVTMPSLYVFSAIAGSPLRFPETLRLLLCGIVVNLALLASFGPVTAFFTLSTESYPFMIILNVAFFTAGGVAGLAFVGRALGDLFALPSAEEGRGTTPPRDAVATGGTEKKPGASLRPWQAQAIFRVWIVIYGAVGAQMGWILRPFIGSPDLPFTLFRERESNFFVAFFNALRALFLADG